MKFSIKYFILVLSMVYSIMANCQYGTVSTTSSCPDEGTGSATISLFIDLFESDWHNPPFSADVENLDTGEEWEGVIGTQQGNLLTGTFDNLTDGEYEVTINVAPTCFLTFEFKIETIIEFDVVSIADQATCLTETRLIWDVNNHLSTHLAWYNFLWTDGSNDRIVTITSPGAYAVTITHNPSGCEHVEEFEFLDYDFKFEGVISSATCAQGASIELFTTPDDPTIPISYLWSNGRKTSTISNLNPGTYCVTVSNEGCNKDICFIVEAPPFTVTENINQTGCSGLPQSISIQAQMVNGGNGVFTYLWDDGVTSNIRTNLSVGQYCYCVSEVNTGTHKKGCINVTSLIHVNATLQPLGICTEGTGQIKTTVTGGTAPFRFNWSNGATTKDLTSLNTGTYTVTVTDKNNCTSVKSATIKFTTGEIKIGEMSPQTSCTSYTLAPVCTATDPDFLPLSYNWSTGQNTSTITINNSGNYCLTVTGANLCTKVKCFDVKLKPEIAETVTKNTNCPSPPSNGSISVAVSGGTPPYLYSYNPGPTNVPNLTQIDNLSPGSYNIVVTDANGCSSSKRVTINDLSNIEFTVTPKDICVGNNTGSVVFRPKIANIYEYKLYKIDVNGNSQFITSFAGYTHNTMSFDGLEIGQYYIEARGIFCQYGIQYFEMKQGTKLPPTDLLANVSCIVKDEEPGKIEITQVIGGTSPHYYKWSNGQTGRTMTTTVPGTYTVTVTDANYCNLVKTYEIRETTTSLFANFELTNPGGCNSKITSVQIEVDILSGNPPYTVKIDNHLITTFTTTIIRQVPVPSNNWTSQIFYAEVVDACGLKQFKAITAACFLLCPDDCFNIQLEDTGIGGCAKVRSGKYALFGWVDHSNFAVKSNCNDQKNREVYNEVQNATISMNGSGHEKFEDLFYGDMWYAFQIRNNTTGCERREFVFTKGCRSFWKILSDIFSGGGNNNNSGPQDCVGEEWQFIKVIPETCEEEYFCPKTNKTERRKVELGKCSIECGKHPTSGKTLYNNLVYCTVANCEIISSEISITKKYGTNCDDCIYSKLDPGCVVVRPPHTDPPTCDNVIKEVLVDTTTNGYIAFWNDYDSVGNNKFIGYSFKDSRSINDFGTFSYFNSGLVIESVRIDTNNNHYILGRNSHQSFQKTNKEGQIQWTINLNEFAVKNISEGRSGNYKLLGYDLVRNLWLIKSFSTQGITLDEQIISLDNLVYQKFLQSNDKVVAYSKSNNLIKIVDSNNTINKSLPTNLTVKDIKSIDNQSFVVIGEYSGSLSLMNKSYNSNNYRNAIFLVYDYSGKLHSVKTSDHPNDMTVNGAAIINKKDMVYYGFQYEIINGPTPEENFVDSCTFVHFYSLPDSCDFSNINLNLSLDSCKLSWTNVPDGAVVSLQKKEGEIWINVSSSASPIKPENNGTYRLSITRTGCSNKISNEIEVLCISEELCNEDPIDITYSETENKFLYFYKTDGGGQLIKSEWISPVTYMMVDSFITWSCENITIKDIFVDENLNVYVIGCDPTITNKTRIIKYNWSTKQIIWSQWREKFVYYSTVPYATNGVTSLNIAGYDTYLQRWYIYGYNRSNGSGTTSQQVNYNFSKGTYEGMRYYKENVFTYYSFGSTGTTISFKGTTGTWQKTLSPLVTVREVTILHNEHTVVGGDFTGTITINGEVYEAYPYRSVIFIEYDVLGNVLNVKIYKGSKHFVLKSFTTDGYYKFAYTGYTTENLNIGENVLLDLELLANHPDACAHVDGGTLSETQLRNAIQVHPESVVKFYPNPFTKGINLDIDSPQKDVVSIVVINSIGSVMFTTKVDVEAGQNVKYLNEFEQLPSGVYTVKLKSDLMDHTTRVIRIE